MSITKGSEISWKMEIQKLCKDKFRSLGEIAEALDANKNTIRSRYLYPMVQQGLLVREHPPGTKSAQRYKKSP